MFSLIPARGQEERAELVAESKSDSKRASEARREKSELTVDSKSGEKSKLNPSSESDVNPGAQSDSNSGLQSDTKPHAKPSSESDEAPEYPELAIHPDFGPDSGSDLGSELAIGHEPGPGLTPQDQALFRAFQANLLSLVSHELRTPLTGILNALAVLDEGALMQGISQEDLIKMARENAVRLHQALTVLLDLANLESGNFQARLKEIDLARVIETRIELHRPLLKTKNVTIEVKTETDAPVVLLADPGKFGRVVDLCLQVAIPRVERDSKITLQTSSKGLRVLFELAQKMEKLWETSWSQSLAGFHAGVGSPHSAFGGVMQSEQAFLSRVEDGFGSEFLLIHEIMKLHKGKFTAVLNDRIAELVIELPEMNSEESLRSVLKSRAFQISHELGAVTLVLIEVPPSRELATLQEEIRNHLFRTTDAVYSLPERNQLALVLDDCKAEDAPKVLSKISRSLNLALAFGVAHCPSDTLDPEKLLALAQERLERIRREAA